MTPKIPKHADSPGGLFDKMVDQVQNYRREESKLRPNPAPKNDKSKPRDVAAQEAKPVKAKPKGK